MDADWDGDVNIQKSVSSLALMLAGGQLYTRVNQSLLFHIVVENLNLQQQMIVLR